MLPAEGHCAAGINRSCSTLVYYFMRSKNMKARDAFVYIKSKRPIVGPHANFIKQLVDFEKKQNASRKDDYIMLTDEGKKNVTSMQMQKQLYFQPVHNGAVRARHPYIENVDRKKYWSLGYNDYWTMIDSRSQLLKKFHNEK